jgi:hypothetical protein
MRCRQAKADYCAATAIPIICPSAMLSACALRARRRGPLVYGSNRPGVLKGAK